MTSQPHAPHRYSYNDEEAIIAELAQLLQPRQKFAIDIAAGDGAHMSNTLRLFENGWQGVAVEMDGAKFSHLAERHRAYTDVSLVRCKVVPGTVCDLLSGCGCPPDPGVLSLDIDSYDHAVLDAIWQRFRPVIVCAEINEKIPYPVKFRVDYDPQHVWATDHFYGLSLASLCELAEAHGYHLVHLEYNNAFLVPGERAVLSRLKRLSGEAAYRAGYLDREDRLIRFPWNRNVEHLHGLQPREVVAEVGRMFASYSGKFRCEA